MNKKIFLGGTWNEANNWRQRLIPQLEELGIDYFNPIVDDWTPAWQDEENRQKKICDFVLYVFTKEMSGVYAIAEVTDDSNKRPKKTIFCYLEEGFEESQIKSLKATGNLVKANGAQVFTSLEETVEYLNKQKLLEQPEQIAQQEQPTKDWFFWQCC